ncbi:protein PLASTID REDOX INSENSITIVE 2, chloroplastic [Heracleum sosnowskyi]|uniref:Protein PLASTID REDOX INSENSITIVE 2, chloroplastic n=1 Tax=Heracleum sosnowskyi TaxID=360622 RepID=A0AAD8IBM7_9APIA|nr:protein PLASTID REDOX INSENSITIVE 2, chloroplastic [Heracleum sosnowskyi]
MASVIASISFLVPSSITSISQSFTSSATCCALPCKNGLNFKDSSFSLHNSLLMKKRNNPNKLICNAAEYKFPDPIPEFAQQETEKFKSHLVKKLSKKDMFGDSIDEVIGVCTEIFSTFMHTEYGGPGTLLVEPFIDMADTLNERGLPGGPQAARAAVKWAQDCVDKDWKEWNSNDSD